MKKFKDVIAELKGKKILVANRGLPARRVARTIREVLDAVPVITATDVDVTSPPTNAATELLLLGPNPRSYLDTDLIISKAKERNIIAIHPGWGFAAEDDSFPRKCEKAGIVFIGPNQKSMHELGNKVEVRRLAKELGIPTVPGSDGAVMPDEARKIAKSMGFPIMLKAEGGGGGRGIYEVYTENELENAFAKASAAALASFGNPGIYVEKLLTRIRHIEIQVVADKYGNAFAFDERDCTVQRNHQKLVEITPSPWEGVITPSLRKQLKEYAVSLIKKVGYYSLATVEFLVDFEGRAYLIEVNTRLQVEHGITECRYGVDLVEEQIAIAFGSKLRFNDKETKPFNTAMQVRINCEDPQHSFAPNAGLITRYLSPGGQGVRVDSCVTSGYDFPAQYDSAASLLIAYGRSWEKVLGIMNRALKEYVISGIKTTILFHREIIRHPKFISSDFDTNFIAQNPELLRYVDQEPQALRLSRLVAEVSAKGYNPFIQLGEYRSSRDEKRLGRFNPVLPKADFDACISPYEKFRGNRDRMLEFLRETRKEGFIHFTDTTTRDITQSNSSNRFRLAEDKLIGPYLDNCGFFSLENGGGAHFHVAMMANMTYPFTEAREWNVFAPKTMKQILIRSTNVLGYKPQPKNLMQKTGEMICKDYHVIRCFDFLNHVENMRPFAEVVLNSDQHVFEPAVSLSWDRDKNFTVAHYMNVVEEILEMVADVAGTDTKAAEKLIILGLKDMAGVCPPRFMKNLVETIVAKYPELVIHSHRHYTDGLFVPAMGAAATSGAHIVDTAIGASVRWYGQGEVLSTAAYIEDDLTDQIKTNLGNKLKTFLNKDMIRQTNFVLKQIMPYYDRYVSPYFQGIDYDVVDHGMPGGATSSSQEGAMKQGYINLLPYMLKFLAGTRKIVHYHDVTPGSQITWNTAFLAVTGAAKEGGDKEVRRILSILEAVTSTPENELSEELKKDRLEIYKHCNDAFRNLLLGKYGRLPLGFPPEWVYKSAFGAEYKQAIKKRTTDSPLIFLKGVDIEQERVNLRDRLNRDPEEEELVMYLNHPGDALKTIDFVSKYGSPNKIPLDIWFEGLEVGQELSFNDRYGKPHKMIIIHISRPDSHGMSYVRYTLDSETLVVGVKTAEAASVTGEGVEMANPENIYHVASPCNGDLWVTYVKPGDVVSPGRELFNISIMKQEKAVFATTSGVVKRVLKFADFMGDKKMVPVKEGELIIELAPVPRTCNNCKHALVLEDCAFCPYCGKSTRR